jgi:Caspase domain
MSYLHCRDCLRLKMPAISLVKWWLWSIVVSFTFFNAPASAETRVALVVGNSTYQNVPRLNNPTNDARLVADTLRSLGFELVGGSAQLDLDKASFDNAVRSFGRQLQGAEVGLFYYAGHGLQVRGANYLVPVNANPAREADLDYELEDVALVLRQMEGSGTRLNLIFLDACRNNPFGGRGLRATEGGLAQMQAPEGTLISFATQPGSVALDGTDAHSPFTNALARTIRKPGLGLFDAINEVGLAVKLATGGSQQPWFSTSPINGAFYFVSLPSGAPPPSSTAPSTTAPPHVTAAPPKIIPPRVAVAPPKAVAPVPARPPPPTATNQAATLVLPKAISPKYSSDDLGNARMHTCLEQYIANKTTNGNAGLKWIEQGGGYYSACNQALKRN